MMNCFIKRPGRIKVFLSFSFLFISLLLLGIYVCCAIRARLPVRQIYPHSRPRQRAIMSLGNGTLLILLLFYRTGRPYWI